MANCTTRCCALLAVMTLLPPASADVVSLEATRDASIIEHPDGILANGAGQYFHVGRTYQSERYIRRGLIAFDIAGHIPADAIIVRAALMLNLSQSQPGEDIITVYRSTTPWTEGTSDPPGAQEGAGDIATAGDPTWLHSSYDQGFWVTPGGDYDPNPGVRARVAEPGTYHWTSRVLVADVRAWHDDPSSNLGWMLVGNEDRPGSSKRFDSRQHPDPAVHPRLVVDYRALTALDFDGDGRVAGPDLALLLAAWGPAADSRADLDGNHQVDAADLAILLAAWNRADP